MLILAALALTSSALPTVPSCTAQAAVWIAPVERQPEADGGPPSETQVWSCRVGGRLLVVKDRAGAPGTYMCSATARDTTSAWVDGVKRLDEDEAGDIQDCYANPDDPRGRLTAIVLDADGVLTLCHRRTDGVEAKSPRCAVLAEAADPAPDPAYRGPDVVTLTGFVLHIGIQPLCAGLTDQLRPGGWFGEDKSLAAFAVPAAAGWGAAYVSNGDMPALSAVFDIDNDGSPDRVELAPVMKVHGLAMGQLSWRPAGSAKPVVAAEPLASASTPPDQPSDDWMAFGWQPVRIEGRTYLYVRRHAAFDWDSGDEDFLASTPWGEKAITRSLIELKPDGSQTLVCAWGPRPKPELYL